jgi:hypothetical protein
LERLLSEYHQACLKKGSGIVFSMYGTTLKGTRLVLIGQFKSYLCMKLVTFEMERRFPRRLGSP